MLAKLVFVFVFEMVTSVANMSVAQIVIVAAPCAGDTYVCVLGLSGCVVRVCDGICLLFAMQVDPRLIIAMQICSKTKLTRRHILFASDTDKLTL